MKAAETLRALLDKLGVPHSDHYLSTTWLDGHGILHLASEQIPNSFLVVDMLTPEQAIAATLGSEINGDTIVTHLNQLESSRYSELFGVDYVPADAYYAAIESAGAIARSAVNLRDEVNQLRKVVQTQAESFAKLERELAIAKEEQ